jgi:hypothetical protein
MSFGFIGTGIAGMKDRIHSPAEPQPNTLTTEAAEIAEKLDTKTKKIANIANACYKMLAKISRLCNRVI